MPDFRHPASGHVIWEPAGPEWLPHICENMGIKRCIEIRLLIQGTGTDEMFVRHPRLGITGCDTGEVVEVKRLSLTVSD